MNGFFVWAEAKGYTPKNPLANIQPIEKDENEPEVLSVEECQRLMQAAQEYKGGKLVPFVALALFAGLRPDQELQRITWDDIDAESESITISGKVAKMRGRRTVEAARLAKKSKGGKDTPLPSNLFLWIAPHVKDHTPIKGKNWRRDFDAVKFLAGFGTPDPDDEKRKHLKPWVQDYMRHTAISYHFALYEHEGKTAKWAGNSPDIVHRKYKGLVKPADVPKFWSIAPAAASNVIQLPKEKAA
jgi:integrase